MNGIPGIVTPAACKPGARRSAMYQMLGSLRERCMSFDSSGFPLAVCWPAITQLFEPAAQPSQSGRPRRARRLVESAVVVTSACEEEATADPSTPVAFGDLRSG